jgi:hypothetical protein
MNTPDPAKQKPTHPGEDPNDLLRGPTDNEWKTDRDLIDQRLADPWEEQQ